MQQSVFASIDFKSFYASVECVERSLNPLTARLVVADASRTEKTICLAVTPALKQLGLPGRCRLFEAQQLARAYQARTGKKLDFIIAPPRMQLYMDYSARIYEKVYLRYIAPEDIHVYSIDEVFIDLTKYLSLYHLSAHDLVRRIIRDVLLESGITATGGIGTNLYLAKVAMDIVAKHVDPDADGVRIAELDETRYRELLWSHRPLRDFWRIGPGISARLEKHNLHTMGDIARLSLKNEDVLYREFGIDAELLIDHAWGAETCTMADIKAFQPETNSISVGQVLPSPYPFDKGRLIVREMADQLALDLVAKGLESDSVTLSIGYDREGATDGSYRGQVETDFYGRRVPKGAHGSQPLVDAGGVRRHTASARKLIAAALAIYDRVVDPALTVRRLYVVFNNVLPRAQAEAASARQLDMFTPVEALDAERAGEARELKMQQTLLEIKQRYGKNAILKGMNYEEGATAKTRNQQIGGHRAGEEG